MVDLFFTYPTGVVALKGINVEIFEREITAIVGQNGSGKTTLAKHFNGLLKPTSGAVIVYGKDTRQYKQKELVSRVGYVFQNPTHQLFNTSIEAEIAFGPTNLGLNPEEVKARVEEAIHMFGLDGYRDVHPLRLSYPYRKLVAIASIYAMYPDIMILDEPTIAQDFFGWMLILKTIKDLKSRGKTVIVITHDMLLVSMIVDRCLVMTDGKIIADKRPRELFIDELVLKQAFLKPPQITLLAQRLSLHDSSIPPSLLTIEEMVEILSTKLNCFKQ
ncbi:MAG: ATP-binding cassette domain-containing protein [Thermoproteota archaeon]